MIEIIKSPNPILRKKNKDVKKIDGEFLKLVDKMKERIKTCGVGLAAPQVGVNLNFSVIGFKPTEEQLKKDPNLIPVPEILLINPKISWRSKETSVEKEGCLSVDKTEVNVERAKKIHLIYRDKELKKQTLKAKGYLARVIQHEVDHLNGILIIDYK